MGSNEMLIRLTMVRLERKEKTQRLGEKAVWSIVTLPQHPVLDDKALTIVHNNVHNSQEVMHARVCVYLHVCFCLHVILIMCVFRHACSL